MDEAGRAGLHVRRDARVSVRTSSRQRGRASVGLASELRRRGRDGLETVVVAHPADEAWRYARHAAARAVFAAGLEPADVERLARAIARSPAHVREVGAACPNGEAFATRLVPTAPEGPRPVALAVAERILGDLEGAERQAA